MKYVFIYALKDPVRASTIYIGKSNNPPNRFLKHLRDRSQNHRCDWIRSLLNKGLKPILEIVDEVLESEWQAAEAAYIEFYRELGFELVNGTNGGDGFSSGECHPMHGRKQTPEWKEKRLSKIRGNQHHAFGKTGDKCPFFGKKLSEEHRQKLSESHLGNKHTEAAKKKIGIASSRRQDERRQAEILEEMWD